MNNTATPIRDFLLNNVGILLGAAIMLILAIFEEKIVF